MGAELRELNFDLREDPISNNQLGTSAAGRPTVRVVYNS